MNTAAGTARLDRMSVPEWLDSTEIGSGSRFGKLMMADTVTENGGDPDDQSALDLIVLLTGNPRSSLSPLPGDDERFHDRGRQRPARVGHDRRAAARHGPPRPCPRRDP